MSIEASSPATSISSPVAAGRTNYGGGAREEESGKKGEANIKEKIENQRGTVREREATLET
jgi:hypothetical protein